jgi:UDP-2-acetamido-2,6-beta-L-arabino-hexul-4-ose reductase
VTFCHNIANGINININDENAVVVLVYIDDVVKQFTDTLNQKVQSNNNYYDIPTTYKITVGEIARLIYSFKDSRNTRQIADLSDEFTKKLYATYLSYLPEDKFSYPLKMNIDDRGSFTEFIRTPDRGQVSVNISKPGVTKGNHWHQTKNEKFLVVKGNGVIKFRQIGTDKVIEYNVRGEKLEVVDIPIGYTHSIQNTGNDDMVTVMWASEQFDPDKPDTIYEEVIDEANR